MAGEGSHSLPISALPVIRFQVSTKPKYLKTNSAGSRVKWLILLDLAYQFDET